MEPVKRPVSIDGIEFDALIGEEKAYESEVPEYPTEDGNSVCDTIIRSPLSLTLTLSVTNTPVTWKRRFGDTQNRVDMVCSQLEELYMKAKPVTVITSDRTYKNMAIESLTLTKDENGRYYREIPITFKQVQVTTAKKTTIPASYYRSGRTAAPAGTASTSAGSKQAASSSSSSSSRSSSGQSSSSGSRGSILYGVGSSLGICGDGAKGDKKSSGGAMAS